MSDHSDRQQLDQSDTPKADWLADGSKRPPVYLVRHKDGLSVYSGSSDSPHLSIEDEVFQSVWSPDGTQLVMNGSSTGLAVYRHPLWNGNGVSENAVCFNLVRFPNSPQYPARSLRHLQWSPKGTFVVAHWQYDHKAASVGQDDRNVLVWTTMSSSSINGVRGSTSTRRDIQPIAAFSLKGVAMGQWPILKWRNDERFCLLSSRSEVVVFDGHEVGGVPLMRIPSLSGVIATEPAPVFVPTNSQPNTTSTAGIGPDGLVFAAFSPTSSATESDALFRIVVVPEVRRKSGSDDWHLSVQKPLGSSDSADISWSPSGATVLVLASTTVDAAGENYGGVGDVYLARFDGSLTVKVNKAVAQEACWNPCRDEFIVIEGKSPSEMYLYDKDCNVQYEFPVAYRNTIRWDCFGLMVALGGFGNLAGDLSFWFRDNEARCMKVIADWREPCTVLCGWSPDGRHFYTASTFPRMKVDNQFKVFNYEGNLLTMKSFPQLLDFQWKPERAGKYGVPCRPTAQSSAIAASKKFKTAKEIASEAKEARRFGAARNRKETQSTGAASNAAASNATAEKKATATVATAAQAAKLERNRQLDSISDWRAAPKEVPKESDSAAVSDAPPQQHQSKRRASAAKQKSDEKNAAGTATSDVSSSPTASSGIGDDVKQQPAQRRNGSSSENSKPPRAATTRAHGATTNEKPPHSGASSKTRSGAVTPSDYHRSKTVASTTPTDPQPLRQQQSNNHSRPLSPLAKDFIMPEMMPADDNDTVTTPSAPIPSRKEAMGSSHSIKPEQSKPLSASQQPPIAEPTKQALPQPLAKPLQQPSTQQPSTQQPSTQQPATQQPATEQPVPQPVPPPRQQHQYTPQQRQQLPASNPEQSNAKTDNNAGLLSLLKSILPPDASVHVARETPNRSHPVDTYDSDFPSFFEERRATPGSAGSTRHPISPTADQFRPYNPPSALATQHTPPSSSPADRVESLVNLLVRAQKERTAAAASRPPVSQYGFGFPHQSEPERVYGERSMANHPNLVNNQPIEHINQGFPSTFGGIPQQQHLRNLSHNLDHQGLPPPMQRSTPNASFNSQPDPHLLQELQNRFRQARGDPRQQAAVLEALQELQNRFRQSREDPRRQSSTQQPLSEQLTRPTGSLPLSNIQQQSRLPPSSISHPRLDPRRDPCWEYLDPKGKIQGPFDINDMKKWHSLGYFEPSLPIRCVPGGDFTPLCRLFPPGTEPFKLS